MELNRLAAKQKRYKDILLLSETTVQNVRLKTKLLNTLSAYRATLADCWRKQTIGPDDVTRIDSLERELETLCGDARLQADPS